MTQTFKGLKITSAFRSGILLRFLLLTFMFVFPGLRIEANTNNLELQIDTDAHINSPDSIRQLQGNILQQEFHYFLRHRALTMNDSIVSMPPFIKKVVGIYKWFDRTFNTHDTLYVGSSGYKGKVEAMGDSWIDAYYFHPHDMLSIRMLSDFYSSVGLKAQYSILSLGYSVNVKHMSLSKSTHRKTDLALNTARVSLEFHLWQNNGRTRIRKFGGYRDGALIDELFEGLKFKSISFGGYYYFNYKKFSRSAAYDASNVQKRSQGTWIAGLSGTFYDARFDFTKLPIKLQEYYIYPFDTYRLYYNSINLVGGYSFNWVLSNHLTFNITAAPGIGMSITFSDSIDGRRVFPSYYLKGQGALTYTYKRLFATISARGDANLLQTERVGFMTGFLDGKVSVGMRF